MMLFVMNSIVENNLLTAAELKEKLGYRCKTNHVLRNLELRGLLFPVRLNSRRLVYDPADVARLIQQSKGGAV